MNKTILIFVLACSCKPMVRQPQAGNVQFLERLFHGWKFKQGASLWLTTNPKVSTFMGSINKRVDLARTSSGITATWGDRKYLNIADDIRKSVQDGETYGISFFLEKNPKKLDLAEIENALPSTKGWSNYSVKKKQALAETIAQTLRASGFENTNVQIFEAKDLDGNGNKVYRLLLRSGEYLREAKAMLFMMPGNKIDL